MTPRTGVYPKNDELEQVLTEEFFAISNRELLHTVIHEPITKIRNDFHAGKGNEFVLMERFRRWCEVVEENIGVWAPMPSWEILIDDEDWCEAIGLDDSLFSNEPEWVIFGDDIDLAWDTLDKLTYSVWMEDDLIKVVALMLELKPGIEELMVTAKDLDSIYVVRSKKVEGCSIEVTDTALSGLHAFPDLANCMEAGQHPTYVLPDDVVRRYVEVREANLKWEREWQAKQQQYRREAAAR